MHHAIKYTFSRTCPTSDGSSVNYIFDVSHQDKNWEISKRFSEFEFLLEQVRVHNRFHAYLSPKLETAKYAQLPALPPKTLPLLTLDTSGVHRRAMELVSLLEKLSQRPDIRYSEPFTKFIELLVSPSTLFAHELSRGRFQLESRFGVVGLVGYSDALIAVHADTTSLSRLGKVWSIVESDELGSLSIWTIRRGRSVIPEEPFNVPLGERIYYRVLSEKPNSFCLTDSTQIVLGLSNGHIQVFDVRSPATATMDVPAHGVSPVVSVEMISSTSIASIGLDDAVRITDMGSKQVVAGGKLSKRLQDREHLSCLSTSGDQIFIGTDKGHVFIYKFAKQVLEFVDKIQLTSYPVRDMKIEDQLLLVGFDCMVSIFDLNGSFSKLGSFTTSSPVHAIRLIPKSSYCLVGLGDGTVALYHWQRSSTSASFQLVYARYFSEDPINVIHYSMPDGVVWIGADDGRVVEVVLPANIASDVAGMVREAALENPCGDGTPQAGINRPEPASAPKLKCCLDENESDNEDWKKNIFPDVRS